MARTRSINSALAQLLSASSFPIYVLDDERKIVYGNPAFFQWTSVDPDQLIGARCDYHSSPEVGSISELAAGLCSPPEAFRGQRISGEVFCRTPSGETSRRRAEFLPLGRDELDLVGVLISVDGEDVTKMNAASYPAGNLGAAELHQRLIAMRQQITPRYGIDRLVGESLVIRRVREQVRLALEVRAHVVVIGSPGSGREHVARTIHYGDDPHSAGRLVPVSCELMDAELLQATITNVDRHPDDLPDLRPPTLLLLDVDQLPETAQYELVSLLNVPGFELQTLSTSRCSLFSLVEAGSFRRDLAFVLSTLEIELPSLANRVEDIPLLAQLFLEQVNAAGGPQLSGFAHDALDQFAGYTWPGNVDELADIVQEACSLADGPLVTAHDLPQRIRAAASAAAYPSTTDEQIVLDDILADVERELIQRAMKRAKGNKTKAAKMLGVTRARLHRRLDQLQAEPNEDDDGKSS